MIWKAQNPPTTKGTALRKTLMITVVVLGLAAAAGCSDSPDVATDESPAPVATVAQDEDTAAQDPGGAARAYMEAMAATDNPGAMRDGLDRATEGSPAYVYLLHRANLAEAALDGGTPIDEFDLTSSSDGFELCDPYGTGDEACGTYADFKTNDSGTITDLTVDGEYPGPRLTTGNGETVEDRGVSAEFLTAYDAISGSGLWVTMRIESGNTPVDVWLYQATYRAPDGGQRQATEALGPIELGAESNARLTLQFASVKPGGTVTLSGVDSADYLTEFELEIKVG